MKLKEENSKTAETQALNIPVVSKSKFSDKKIAEVREEVVRCNRCRSDLYLYGYLNEKENQKIHDKLKKLVDKYQIVLSREDLR